MSTCTVGPINLINGLSVNPFNASPGWAPGQTKYAVIFNTSQYPIVASTLQGPLTIAPFQANVVSTLGGNLTIAPAPLIGTPKTSLTYLGVCNVTLYDEAEDFPSGYPSTLSSGAAGYLIAAKLTSAAASGLLVIPAGSGELVFDNTGNAELFISVTGATTGISYSNGLTAVPNGQTVPILVNGPDSEVILSISGSGGNLSVYAYPSASPVYTVNVANPAAGSNWSYTLPAPSRLMGVSAQLAAGGAGNRYPALWITYNSGFPQARFAMTAAALAGITQWLQGSPGMFLPFIAPGADSSGVPPSQYGFAPDLFLPAGTVISSSTGGLLATDQWSNIYLTLSAV